tara:strand:+ start:302 stop:598 length:297 start_codon:yes stop_codon:yes gene_type:complete
MKSKNQNTKNTKNNNYNWHLFTTVCEFERIRINMNYQPAGKKLCHKTGKIIYQSLTKAQFKIINDKKDKCPIEVYNSLKIISMYKQLVKFKYHSLVTL